MCQSNEFCGWYNINAMSNFEQVEFSVKESRKSFNIDFQGRCYFLEQLKIIRAKV